MNLDIETEHVIMQPEWHRMIDTWVARLSREHPEVAYVDVSLRHGDDGPQPREEVDVLAIAGDHDLRVARRAETMTTALLDALNALERELAVGKAARGPPQ